MLRAFQFMALLALAAAMVACSRTEYRQTTDVGYGPNGTRVPYTHLEPYDDPRIRPVDVIEGMQKLPVGNPQNPGAKPAKIVQPAKAACVPGKVGCMCGCAAGKAGKVCNCHM